jgi:predicted NBD/HSP70 family sugar kinase
VSVQLLERPFTASLIGQAEPQVIVADIGASWTSMVAGSEPIQDLEITKCPTPRGYDEAIAQLGRAAYLLLDGKRPDAFGFGVAGQLTDGFITEAGQLKEYGWQGKPIIFDIADELGLGYSQIVGMNDMAAAAKGEQTAANRAGDTDTQAIFTWSTGFGGALFTPDKIIPDEPGHQHLRPGAMCGCGRDGCLEAYISGSGIARRFNLGENYLPADDPRWALVKADSVVGVDSMLDRYKDNGYNPRRLSFFGSVALKGPGMLDSLRAGLGHLRPYSPRIGIATFGDNSGLQGAYFAAREVV